MILGSSREIHVSIWPPHLPDFPGHVYASNQKDVCKKLTKTKDVRFARYGLRIWLNITAAVRLIGSVVYIFEPLRAPRAFPEQRLASQRAPRSSKSTPWCAKGCPEAIFPNSIEKPYESHETSLKKVKKTLRESSVQLPSTV